MGFKGLVHGINREPLMSALGQKQTSRRIRAMSALPPKADIGTHPRNVRFAPNGDILGDRIAHITPSRASASEDVECLNLRPLRWPTAIRKGAPNATCVLIEAVKPHALNFPLQRIVVASVSCQSNVCRRD